MIIYDGTYKDFGSSTDRGKCVNPDEERVWARLDAFEELKWEEWFDDWKSSWRKDCMMDPQDNPYSKLKAVNRKVLEEDSGIGVQCVEPKLTIICNTDDTGYRPWEGEIVAFEDTYDWDGVIKYTIVLWYTREEKSTRVSMHNAHMLACTFNAIYAAERKGKVGRSNLRDDIEEYSTGINFSNPVVQKYLWLWYKILNIEPPYSFAWDKPIIVIDPGSWKNISSTLIPEFRQRKLLRSDLLAPGRMLVLEFPNVQTLTMFYVSWKNPETAILKMA